MAKTKFREVEYDIPEEFTNRELMEIERVSGVPASVVDAGLREKEIHYATVVAWTWIAIKRSGAKVKLDELLDAPAGSIEWITDDEGTGPLEQEQPGDEPSEQADPATDATDGNPDSPSFTESVPGS